jgi:hypothetical protein
MGNVSDEIKHTSNVLLARFPFHRCRSGVNGDSYKELAQLVIVEITYISLPTASQAFTNSAIIRLATFPSKRR